MESDATLIEKVKKENDAGSLQILIERHSGIYLEMVNSVIPNNCTFLDKNDLIEDKNYYLSMSQAHNPYGDGFAAARIVEVLQSRI
jgi:UDP-N-acetylglucosamine 2-epimerase